MANKVNIANSLNTFLPSFLLRASLEDIYTVLIITLYIDVVCITMIAQNEKRRKKGTQE